MPCSEWRLQAFPGLEWGALDEKDSESNQMKDPC